MLMTALQIRPQSAIDEAVFMPGNQDSSFF